MVRKLPPDFLEFAFLASPYTRIQTCPVSHLLLLITVIFSLTKTDLLRKAASSGQWLNQITSVVKEHTLFVTPVVWELYWKTLSG